MKIVGGGTLHLKSLFTVKSLLNFQMYHPHEIKIAKSKITKICSETKIWVLKVNLGSEISYDTS